MAKHFDLKKQLRLHDKGLLRRLFAEHGLLEDFSWEELSSRRIDPLIARWDGIEEPARRVIQVVLQDVHELAEERGQRVLAEELAWRFPEKLPVFAGWSSLADKALWAYLEAREAFDEAALFARAEALRNGQFAARWNSLPPGEITVSESMVASLEEALRDYYWRKELRGSVCRVHHDQRPGGAEYFFAYLPDWPDKRLVFDAAGNLTAREEAYTFSNVFIYEPAAGAMELVAKGGRPVHLALRRAFCGAVLGIEVDDAEPVQPTYRLDHLLDPGFSFETEPEDRIAAACRGPRPDRAAAVRHDRPDRGRPGAGPVRSGLGVAHFARASPAAPPAHRADRLRRARRADLDHVPPHRHQDAVGPASRGRRRMTEGITFRARVHFRRDARGRKQLCPGENPAAAAPSDRVPRLARLMALAIRFDGLVRRGEVADQAELARLGRVTRARITQIMNLLVLAPDIQEELLFLPPVQRGRDPLVLRHLLPIGAEPDWHRQRQMWQNILSPEGNEHKGACRPAL